VLIGAVLPLSLYGYWMPRHRADLKHAYRQATEKHLVSVAEGLVPHVLARQLDTVYENPDARMLQNANWESLRLFNADGIMVYPLFPPPPPPAGLDVCVMEQAVRVNEHDLGRLVVEWTRRAAPGMHLRHRQPPRDHRRDPPAVHRP